MQRITKFWLATLLGLFVLGYFLLPLTLPHQARLWVLSVGQGESVLYQDTSGKSLLFDGGPDDTVLSELGRILPPWHRYIDVVVLSHTHVDHVRGLISVLERYRVGEVWESGALYPGGDMVSWHKLIQEKNIPDHIVFAGIEMTIGNTHILTMHPMKSMVGVKVPEAHDATVVLQMTIDSEKILLTGDLNEKHEADIMAWCQPPKCSLQSDILQVPHHGSDTGLSPPFLAAVQPQFAFICVGQNNSYHHPRAIILQLLEESHIPYQRTDTQGGVKITFGRGRFVYENYGSAPR